MLIAICVRQVYIVGVKLAHSLWSVLAMTIIGEITRDGGRHALRMIISGRGRRGRRLRARAVNLLMAGVRTVAAAAPVDERLALYTGADAELTPRRRDASIDVVLKGRLSALLVLLERCIPAFAGSPNLLYRGMMETVIGLCEQISRGPAAENPYWRCIVDSLRAECLIMFYRGIPEDNLPDLLVSRVLMIISDSEAAYAMIPEPRDSANDRHLFNRAIVAFDWTTTDSALPHAATLGYIQRLIDEINAA
jgi:hypothetical protein